MTKKLEETFNLPSVDDFTDTGVMKTEEEMIEQSAEIVTALDNTEKIDHALSTVTGLQEHDTDMNDIAYKAIQSYQDLTDLALNVADAHAGRIMEVAATMLKTALEAKDAKVNRKLKTIELQLKKAKLDQDYALKRGEGIASEATGNEFDRNELLKILKGNISDEQ